MRTEYEVNKIIENAEIYATNHINVSEYPVCAYLRKSEEDEKESSLPTQLNGIKDTIKEINAQLTNKSIKIVLNDDSIYKEDDVSGTTTYKRYQLKNMRDAIKSGKYISCFVLRLDRLSRNPFDRNEIKREMMNNHCNLISSYNKDEGDEQSEMLDEIDGAFSLYFARISARNSVDAVKKKVSELKVVSTLPLGLMKDPNTNCIVIDPETAPIIKEMFNYALEGDSLYEICRKLNSKGYRNKNGREFKRAGVSRMLRNVKYKGVYNFSVDGTSKENRHKHSVSLVKHNETIVENAFDAIIDSKTFNRVQAILDTRTYTTDSTDFMLSGILYCKDCKSKMIGSRKGKRTDSNTRKVYFCNNHKGENALCSTKMINGNQLDLLSKRLTHKIITNLFSKYPQLINKSLKEQQQGLAEEKNRYTKMYDNYERQLSAVIDQIISNSQSIRTVEMLNKKKDEIEKALDLYENKITEINEKLSNVESKLVKDGARISFNFDKLFENINLSKRIILAFIDKVEVGNDSIDFYIK